MKATFEKIWKGKKYGQMKDPDADITLLIYIKMNK